MKLLSKELLIEYGFTENPHQTKMDRTIMIKNKFEITMMNDGTYYYSNFGIDYPIRDLTGLRKLYKEVKGGELKV